MLTFGDRQRAKLFEIFSNNLKYWLSKNNLVLSIKTKTGFQKIDFAIVICPLCLHGYTIEALNQSNSNPLTIEHVPPKSVGGKPLMLLCKECNNSKGSEMDYEIQSMLEHEPFLKMQPNTSIPGKINLFDTSKLPLKLILNEDKNIIFQIDTKGIFYVENRIVEQFSQSGPNSAKFEIKLPNKKLYGIALLRSGYLLAFNYFGYDFLFGDNISIIRKQIQNPNEMILPHSSLNTNDSPLQFAEGLHIVTSPSEFRSYVVIFKTKTCNTVKYNTVFLPGPGASGWEKYQNLKSLNSSITLTLKELASIDMLKNSSLVDGYGYIWNNLV